MKSAFFIRALDVLAERRAGERRCEKVREKLAAAEAKLAEAQEQLRVSVSGGRLVLEDLATTRGALKWMRNLASGVGKAGGEPEPGEYEAACDAADAALRGEGEK